MLNSANPTPRQRKRAPQPTAHAGDPVSSGHGFSRAVQRRPQEPSPFVHPDAGRARLSNSRRLRRASANYSHSTLSIERRTGIMSTSLAKLDFSASLAKSITSNFLIDNFCTLLRSPVSKSTSVGSSGTLHSPLACCAAAASSRRRVTRHSLVLTKEGSLPSNRQCPELEMGLSHRKQRTEIFLIANFRPMLRNLIQRGERVDCSRLSTLDSRLPSLIANDTHSREKSSYSKLSTYQFLIANVFHRQYLASTAIYASLSALQELRTARSNGRNSSPRSGRT